MAHPAFPQRGWDTLLWVYVTDQRDTPLDTSDDAVAVQALRDISGYATDAGLRVALYPHTGFFVQRVEEAVRLAEKVDRKTGPMYRRCCGCRIG